MRKNYLNIFIITGIIFCVSCKKENRRLNYSRDFDLGNSLFSNGNYIEAEKHYRKALNYADLKRDSISIMTNLFSLYYLQKERSSDALDILDSVSCCLDYNDSTFNKLFYTGAIEYRKANYSKALKLLMKSNNLLLQDTNNGNWIHKEEIDFRICRSLGFLQRIDELEEYYTNECGVEAKSYDVILGMDTIKLDSLFPGNVSKRWRCARFIDLE